MDYDTGFLMQGYEPPMRKSLEQKEAEAEKKIDEMEEKNLKSYKEKTT